MVPSGQFNPARTSTRVSSPSQEVLGGDLSDNNLESNVPEVVASPPTDPVATQEQVARSAQGIQSVDVVQEAMNQAGLSVEDSFAPLQSSDAEPAMVAIPEELEGLISVRPSSSCLTGVARIDWRVAEEPFAQPVWEGKGKTWILRGGQEDQCLQVCASLFLEKIVSGKTLLALTSKGLSWSPLVVAFGRLKQPSEPGLLEPEQRKMRRLILSNFLTAKDSPFPKALGEWEAGEGSKSIVVGKLPMLMQEVLERKRQARPSSPPLAFNFEGKAGSEAEGFLSAVNSGDGDPGLKSFLS